MSEEKAKRKRTETIFVAIEIEDASPIFHGRFADSEEVRRWVHKEGVGGDRYQVAQLIGEPISVKVDMVEKRSLVPAGGEGADE